MKKDIFWLKTFQAACSAGWLSSHPLSCALGSKLVAIELMMKELMIELLMGEGVAAVALMSTLASR